ncbi:PTS transporter subunit EIIC [Chitiniphilus purpureus]|uniref:PTS transporter subunit EIIC n=1 Tax=Chitiniphilus purpureus TaxID=2981137 RepID=A0ABY6DPI3_9NEIS|nr:PTS transporter subunit EIIC [Chitiniphilus sp. CD1]UXY16261.1 PTS transporter subunit EIIC [Chitiniphilus sp. CD1]
MAHDYHGIAREILALLGGAGNIAQLTHCITRLRLVLHDPSLAQTEALQAIPLVKAALASAGGYQIVIGAGEVEQVHAELAKLVAAAPADAPPPAAVHAVPAAGEPDYRHVAGDILAALGGAENVEQLTYCLTRLRCVLRDDRRAQLDVLQAVPLVKGALAAAGLHQIVIGPDEARRVYDELTELIGAARMAAPPSAEPRLREVGARALQSPQRIVRMFADVFVPILPAIVAAGLLMGINNLLGVRGLFFDGESVLTALPQLDGLWRMISLMASTSLVFLPALVGWAAARRFGGSELLGLVLGLMLVHPQLLNASHYGRAAAGINGAAVPYFDILGLFQVEQVGYQGQILPMLVTAWVMSRVELWLRARVAPNMQMLIVPITTLVVSGVLALAVIGPVTRHAGGGIAQMIVWLFQSAPLLGGLLFGLLYAPLVATGMHHMFLAADLQLMAVQGGTFIWPMIALCNVAQGSAALAMAWIAKAGNERGMDWTSALSAYFGIAEPALFGVNLRHKFPFYAALIGSAMATTLVSMHHVTASAIGVGGLPAVISVVPAQIPVYLVGVLIVLLVPLGLTWLLSKRYRRLEITDPVLVSA